jgi:uncharacterized membrane protein YtjA (UPF0391 family)
MRGTVRRADLETQDEGVCHAELGRYLSGGIAGVSIEIAKTIFFIAVVLFLVSAVVGLARGRRRV